MEKICPMPEYNYCIEDRCAWWDAGNNCCCVKAIAIELIKLGEAK